MKILLSTLLVLFTLFSSITTVALAGAKWDEPVRIYETHFRGSMGSARNSPDWIQQIGCYTQGTTAVCEAVDNAFNWRRCSTSAPEHLRAIRSITDSALITVRYTGGTCTWIEIYSDSLFEAKN